MKKPEVVNLVALSLNGKIEISSTPYQGILYSMYNTYTCSKGYTIAPCGPISQNNAEILKKGDKTLFRALPPPRPSQSQPSGADHVSQYVQSVPWLELSLHKGNSEQDKNGYVVLI
jgi:hypothetical protein